MANQYKTLNPLGSTSPKDLSDNASNFDEAANSESPAWIDRFGKRRQSWAGMEAAFAQFLLSSGFEFIGDYDTEGPLTISRPNQVFSKDGQYWRAGPSLTLPYTTVNNWATDAPKFVVEGDGALRADLASADPSKGAALVYGTARQVLDIATLRAGNGGVSGGDQVNVVSYRNSVPGVGGGPFVWDAISTEADNGSTVIKAASVATGRWKRALAGPMLITQAGAQAGVDCSAAIVAAYTLSSGVVFPAGSFRLTGIVTIPKNSYVEFLPGAQLALDSSSTLAVRCQVKSDKRQLFSGAGIVVGIRQTYPEWWGAKGDGTGDDQPAIQAAHDCLSVSQSSAGDRPSLILAGPTYQVAKGIVVLPSADINLAIKGSGTIFSGTRIVPSSTFSDEIVFHVRGATGGTQPVADWSLSDIGIVGTVSKGTATIGLQVGSDDPSENLIGLQQNLVENVLVSNFPICIKVIHARMILWSRVSVWNDNAAGSDNVGLYLDIAGGFTGDMRFEYCQFVANTQTNNRGVVLDAGGGVFVGSSNQMAGIKFSACDFYGADIKVFIAGANGSKLSDIWFTNGCQWDGSSNTDVKIQSSNLGTSVDDIHFEGVFMAGGNLSPLIPQIVVESIGTGGSITDIFFTGCILQLAQGQTLLVNDNGNTGKITGVTLNGNVIKNNNNLAGAAIQLKCQRITAVGNRADRDTTNFFSYFIQYDAGCDYMVDTGNMAAGIAATSTIRNLSGAAHYASGANL